MQVLEPQRRHLDNVELWVDERIWGHRFYNDQTPWLLLLEFFVVFHAQEGRAFSETRVDHQHEEIHYHLPMLGPLRYLVFNNPHLQHMKESLSSDSDRWHHWLESVADNGIWRDFGYLRERFSSFSRFVSLIEFYQNTAVEAHRQRRWTSRFLYPYGPDCIYADLDGKRGIGSPDRRFFARGGELLYLMLGRSGVGEALAMRIGGRLMRPEERWNRIARALLPDAYESERNVVANVPIGYLPYPERPEYRDLARDWLALLRLELPGTALLDPLMRVTGLHMLLYLLRRSHEEVGDGAEPRIVLEIAGPRKTLMFDLSNESYSTNRMLPRRALEAHLEATRSTEDWRRALTARDPAREAYRHLQEKFYWKHRDQPGGGPDRIFRVLLDVALGRHSQHLAKVLPEWSRGIGLLTSRRGTGTWYAPDDAFLKALVMATVEEREEYHRFLAMLYDKYRIVIGVAEAERAYGQLPTDERALANNAGRLEQRLRTLGLLHRLSDDCAYVTNPFEASP